MQIKIDKYILDELAEGVAYVSTQIGGGPDEEDATRGLMETVLLIIEDATEAGWAPSDERVKERLKELIPDMDEKG